MIEDATSINEDRQLDADVCIVGAGPAGITLALELIPTMLRVVVLESGGPKPDADVTDLSRGRSVGRPYHDLAACRSRGLGGTSQQWGGLCRPLDAVDFEVRAHVPHSGWPFDRATLDPFYLRAQKLLSLAAGSLSPDDIVGGKALPLPLGPDVDVDTTVLQIVQSRRRFASAFKRSLAEAERLQLFLRATVTRIALDPSGRTVRSLSARVPGGARMTVRARRYVLAAGGLENPRLLLVSNDIQRGGVGNEHDLVGRFFMDHPHTDREGVLVAGDQLPSTELYRRRHVKIDDKKTRVWGLLSPTAAAMKREKILNFSAVLRGQRADHARLADLAPLGLSMIRATAQVDAFSRREQANLARVQVFTLGTPSEQAPNPASRVRVANEDVDAHGVPRLELDWRLSPIDKRTIRVGHQLIARALVARGLGRLKVTLTDDDETWPSSMQGGCHHMGTTRMHRDPRSGVTDAFGRVHGVDNLCVAGSSLFPTSGAADPTLTIVALAQRLADQLKTELL